MMTLGVEEEYLLVDPVTGLPVPEAERTRAAIGGVPTAGGDEVQLELLQVQVEIATPVCVGLEEVADHLRRLRGSLDQAARSAGCRIAACGSAPFIGTDPVPVTDRPRYRMLSREARQLVDEQLINGMHCHVAVPDRAAGVAVLNRLRPWLPVLGAMGANSPMWEGRDTGFADWRTVVFDRWPVSGLPPRFVDAEDYERRVDALLATGVITDRGQLYWRARLSENYPTVEVRALDTQLEVEDAVVLAGVVRALAITALEEEKAGTPLPDIPAELLGVADWHAARHGLGGTLVDPFAGRARPAADVVGQLLEHIGPALARSGDEERVTSGVERILREGTGAERQRRAVREGGPEALVRLLVERTAAP
ncbi:YbdK family carboxylate-amine ligase [Streptomyces alkaliphilus]|uniref:Putative glutamate--cysteine ligase 2 n=1 Tax=Streptomyces alkaliphilus TaxID=1472722 RepID=A0A7W3TF50_9ACTN|nr:glutamate--cysteine ligase [Streptomyces alkaliphilus]MBB0245693.1 YbdK family carboxylate-amine ligase [Streptomyces alkaliphilus]